MNPSTRKSDFLQFVKKLEAELAECHDSNRCLKSGLLDILSETERLRAQYPLHDLFAAKQARVRSVKQTLAALPKAHPERTVWEEVYKNLLLEREELRRIVNQADLRFHFQLERIQSAVHQLQKLENFSEIWNRAPEV